MTSQTDDSPPLRSTRVMDPEQIALQAGRQMPFLRLPVRASLFADRQMRLRQLAAAHPMREYLVFIADLAQAQHEVLQDYPEVPMPDNDALRAAGKLLRPPMPADLWPRNPQWLDGLRRVLGLFRARLQPGPALDTVDRLLGAPEAWVEQQANLLLRRVTLGLDLATAPLVAAGLQTYWTQLVLQIAGAHGDKVFGHTDPGTLCPCCGSAPIGSVTRVGAEESGFRYLACSLCSAQWHYVRIKCTHCQSTKGIHFEELVAQPGIELPATGARPGAIKAECCDTCHHYMKQFVMEKDLEVEAAADDLASLTLDMLVTEAGYERGGNNLMLLFGEPEPDDGGGG